MVRTPANFACFCRRPATIKRALEYRHATRPRRAPQHEAGLGFVLFAIAIIAALWAGYFVYLADKPAWLLAVPLILLLPSLGKHVRQRAEVLTLEGDHLTLESGLLSQTRRTLDMAKVQDVTVRQTFPQRLLGVGDLCLETAGETGSLAMLGIDRPRAVAEEILRASRQAMHARTQARDMTTPAGGLCLRPVHECFQSSQSEVRIAMPFALFRRRGRADQLSQHIRQNAAVAVVLDFLRRIDSDQHVELLYGAICGSRGYRRFLRCRQPFRHARNRITLNSRQSQRVASLARHELQRKHAHADQIRAMDALEALRNHGANAQQQNAFRGPVARRSRAVFLACDDDQWNFSSAYFIAAS